MWLIIQFNGWFKKWIGQKRDSDKHKKTSEQFWFIKKRNDFIQVETTQDSISISKFKLTQKQEITV